MVQKIKNGLNRQNFLLLGSGTLLTSLGLGQLANAQERSNRRELRRTIGNYERIVRRMFTTGENKDAGAFVTFFTENARYRVGNTTPVIGRAAIQESVQKYAFDTNQSFYHNLKQFWEDKNTLVVQFELEMITLQGKPVGPFPIVDVFRFQGNLISDMQIYGDVRDIYPVPA